MVLLELMGWMRRMLDGVICCAQMCVCVLHMRCPFLLLMPDCVICGAQMCVLRVRCPFFLLMLDCVICGVHMCAFQPKQTQLNSAQLSS